VDGRTATLEFRSKLRQAADQRLVVGADTSKVMASAEENRDYAAYTQTMEVGDKQRTLSPRMNVSVEVNLVSGE
jgi:hypothetical protein